MPSNAPPDSCQKFTDLCQKLTDPCQTHAQTASQTRTSQTDTYSQLASTANHLQATLRMASPVCEFKVWHTYIVGGPPTFFPSCLVVLNLRWAGRPPHSTRRGQALYGSECRVVPPAFAISSLSLAQRHLLMLLQSIYRR